ncbi:hypothetical protein BU24DRAFT_135781 [Aaosphaeria arxii CBS 175.79]|uniref:Transcription factor domain-containing protein n=1 Tax=Aaosphaeria arxii CBS 175.79 TaxID=1450172 RepID=A0A6A5Y4Q3_9PLEO|nr:uncharacterized protein BU24DRAFT_135781 [Aaosphaeria arxii CBS 175.79]KAF2020236.1 hypothetical protein BU24DRAFT_135781 [Aaosphaeria arxii CBS 175.79]
MSPPGEPKQPKRRVGRRRLPPLAPGPEFKFVVASHPDHFKDDQTMRHVRSHVMYNHRGEHRGESVSPSERSRSRDGGHRSARGYTRTPSPNDTVYDGFPGDGTFLAPSSARRRSTVWDGELQRLLAQSPSVDPIRSLAARIISAITAEPARSAPPTFSQGSEYPFPSRGSVSQESLENLKAQYADSGEFCQARSWMEVVCRTHMSFLSHVSASCVYQDVAEGYIEDGALTVYAKTKVVRMIKDNLHNPETQADDFMILSILHLLISEIGGSDEDVFNMHFDGLVRIVHQRGGVANLGARISAFLTIVTLSFTILRSQPEPAMLSGFVPSRRRSTVIEHPFPISPLFAPHGDLSRMYGCCSEEAYEILCDMHELTRTFVSRWNYANSMYHQQASPELMSYDNSMQQIYTRLLYRPSSIESDVTPDWTYESIRLASLIYCRSIVQRLPFSESGNMIHAQRYTTNNTSISVICALRQALDNTDRYRYWGEMNGVFLWICLVGGAATSSHQPGMMFDQDERQSNAAWTRKCFSLYALRGALGCGLEHAGAVVEAQRTMLQVQSLINLNGSMGR